MKRYLKWTIIGGVVIIILANYIVLLHRPHVVDVIDQLEPAQVGLVFGGGMIDDETMSDLQTDRVQRGVDLYLAGKVLRLRMTGDNGANRFNEVDAMKAYAVSKGVAPEDIDLDRFGYNTYTSCLRAAQTYELEKIIAVSQTFHLSRIHYFCEGQGIGTQVISADLRDYGTLGEIWTMGVRESLARVKAVWQMEITKPKAYTPNKKS